MIVYTASDHAGFNLRKTLVERLRTQGHEVVDLGTDSDAACDYPEFASALANSVRNRPGAVGILVCATGQGMAIAAGKVRGIRAVVPATVEAARLSRFDNNANVLCLAGRLMSEGEAYAIVDTWLSTGFAGGRHARRIAKVAAIETASAVAFITESERLGLTIRGVPSRLFARDPGLFDSDPSRHASVAESLGWLDFPSQIAACAGELNALAVELRKSPVRDLLVLVDRAERSAAIVTCRLWPQGPARPRLHILDDDVAMTSAMEHIDFRSAFVWVASRGATDTLVERRESDIWNKMQEAHHGDVERTGKRFLATLPMTSPLEQVARAHRYRSCFTYPASIADSFTAAAFQAPISATLAGLDVGRILAQIQTMAESCRADRLDTNPGVSLGMLIGALAKHGRNKLTLLLSKSVAALGPWIADVMARAPGAAPGRVQTLWNEPLQLSYPPDRTFVHVQAADDIPAIAPHAMEALHMAGQPYIQIAIQDKHDLPAELVRWQVAATVAALVIQPTT